MNEYCSELQLKLLEKGFNKQSLSHKEMGHIENCIDCNNVFSNTSLANKILKLNLKEEASPPVSADFNIKNYAYSKTQETKENIKTNFILKFLLPIATAAAVIVAFSNMFIIYNSNKDDFIALKNNFKNDEYEIKQGLNILNGLIEEQSENIAYNSIKDDDINEMMTMNEENDIGNNYSDIVEKLTENNLSEL
ncbi:hypothetical protein AAEX28_03265 [Lentisphaerota bacterium WC36G]|nr:hypothetical protein LJT99_06140 [Lentisphaerae bacterium WC36]